jgi:hypothetical protein
LSRVPSLAQCPCFFVVRTHAFRPDRIQCRMAEALSGPGLFKTSGRECRLLALSGPDVGVRLRRFAGVKRTSLGTEPRSENDLGCVKTCAHEKRVELFSLLSCPDNRRQRFCFSNLLKSRRNFRSQIQFRSFHAAKTLSGRCPDLCFTLVERPQAGGGACLGTREPGSPR